MIGVCNFVKSGISSGAARLTAIPAGVSPVSIKRPVRAVVISNDKEGDRFIESLEVKAFWG